MARSETCLTSLVLQCGVPTADHHSPATDPALQNRVPEDVLATQVDPAAFEISGHVIMKRQQDYEELTQDAIWRLLALSSFTGQAWEDFKLLALNL